MSEYFEMVANIARASASQVYAEELQKARVKNGHLNDRIQQLEVALNRMICAHENTLSESDGRFPLKDSGCPDCTSGTVPDNRNTGRCAYHEAKVLLGQL